MDSKLEEKILDGPRVHYCDAEDDDIRKDEVDEASSDNEQDQPGIEKHDIADLFRPITEEDERLERLQSVNWAPSSTNTGPKGVIGDYLRKREQARNNKSNGIIDRPLTEDEKLELEFEELLNDETIMKEYISKRISMSQNANSKTFGRLQKLETGDQLLDAIDDELAEVLIIVHIYTKYSRACTQLNRCLDKIATQYEAIKFVTLDASVTKLSSNFKENGVPAILAYKGGDLVTSLVQLEEFLDKDFGTEEVKELLFDRGLIIDMR